MSEPKIPKILPDITNDEIDTEPDTTRDDEIKLNHDYLFVK